MNVFPVDGDRLLLVRPGCYITSSAAAGSTGGQSSRKTVEEAKLRGLAEELEPRGRRGVIPVWTQVWGKAEDIAARAES